ncbi:MAG: glutaredoxin family protein [Bdellovibrionota bacterium]|jgi:glutaredoxin
MKYEMRIVLLSSSFLFLTTISYSAFAKSLSEFEVLLVQDMRYETPSQTSEYKAHAENEVILYVTSWCSSCKKAERFLRRHNISFQRYDIEKDMAALNRYRQFGAQAVPVMQVNRQLIVGFNEVRLRQALNLQ